MRDRTGQDGTPPAVSTELAYAECAAACVFFVCRMGGLRLSRTVARRMYAVRIIHPRKDIRPDFVSHVCLITPSPLHAPLRVVCVRIKYADVMCVCVYVSVCVFGGFRLF